MADPFVSELTGLSSATHYHVRAYATSSAGTSYGSEVEFDSATLRTGDTSGSAALRAARSADVTGSARLGPTSAADTLGSAVLRASRSADVAGSATLGSASGFASYLTGLEPSTHYYVRAYATSPAGTSYGAEVEFDTSAAPRSADVTGSAVLGEFASLTFHGLMGSLFHAKMEARPPTDPETIYPAPTASHDWQATLEGPSRTDVVTCAAYLGAEHVADLIVTDGSVTADCRRAIMRTCTLEIAPDGSYTHAEMYNLLGTPGLELRPRRGVQYADGVIETRALGCYVIDELSYAETAAGTQLSAQCSDVSVRVQRAALTDAYQMIAGGSLADLVTAALRDRYVTVAVGFTSLTVPANLAASVVLGLGSGSNPWSELQAVMLAHGYLLYLDADGVVQVTVPVDPGVAVPAYTYRQGAAALVTERTRILPLQSAYNGVIVSGEGSEVPTPVRYEAWDDDPRSPTYYLGTFGKVPRFISSSMVTTEAQAAAMAMVQLSLAKGRRDEYSFAALVRPELAPLDVVGMERSDGSIDVYVIDQVTTPLSPTGAQTAVTRSSVSEA